MTAITRHPPVSARRGDRLSFDAPREGVGGYRWSADIDPGVGAVTETGVAQPGGLVGGGAVARFALDIVGPGTATLRLSLRRPWEKDAAEIVEYPIRVES